MVYQLGLQLLGDSQEALDLSQEVFLSVFRTLSYFRGQSTLRTWIYRIVVNQASNRLRWWRRRRKCAAGAARRSRGAARRAGRVPKLRVSRIACSSSVRPPGASGRHSGSLPFDQRTAIVLREIHGLSYEEIAASLGVAVGTVKSRLARARSTLRSTLWRHDHD